MAAEIIGIAQSEDIKATYGVSVADATALADQIVLALPVTLTDGIGAADVLALARGLTALEQIGVAPVTDPKIIYGLSLADQVSLSDALLRFLDGTLAETVGITEATLEPTRFTRLVLDTVGVQGDLTPQLVLRVTGEATVTLDAAEALKMAFSGELTDVIDLSAAYIQPNSSFTTWAVNTRTRAVTEYTNYDFNSYAQMGHKYLGATSAGIYELNGDDDAGTAIPWALKSGLLKFAGSRFTGFQAIYLGMRASGDVYLRLVTGDGVSRTYRVTVDDMRTTRINVGKGVRASYFSFELEGVDGQDFDLDMIEFVPMAAQRRV